MTALRRRFRNRHCPVLSRQLPDAVNSRSRPNAVFDECRAIGKTKTAPFRLFLGTVLPHLSFTPDRYISSVLRAAGHHHMFTVANALHWIAKTYRSPGVRLKRIRAVADSCCAV